MAHLFDKTTSFASFPRFAPTVAAIAVAMTGLVAGACSSPAALTAPTPTAPTIVAVTLRLTNEAATPLVGWFVCREESCSRTDAAGAAQLALPLHTASFLTFRGPDATWGEIVTPTGAPIDMVIR